MEDATASHNKRKIAGRQAAFGRFNIQSVSALALAALRAARDTSKSDVVFVQFILVNLGAILAGIEPHVNYARGRRPIAGPTDKSADDGAAPPAGAAVAAGIIYFDNGPSREDVGRVGCGRF